MDTLFDKIFSPTKHSETSFIRKLTAPQALKNSSSLLQNMPIEYQQQLIEDTLYSSDFNNTESSNAFKTNLQGLFRTFNHSMLPHIPQVSPCSNLIQEYHRLFNNSFDTVANSISDLNILLHNMPEKAMEEHHKFSKIAPESSFSDHLVVSIADACSPNKAHKVAPESSFSDHLVVSIADACSPNKAHKVAPESSFSDHLVMSIADASSPNNKAHFNVTISKTMPLNTSKKIAKEECNLDQQMANRKAKELQKRSKKRRRRQKKSNPSSTTSKGVQNHNIQVNCDANRRSPISNEEKNCDILCDVTVSHDSKSVQIVLPNLSSFVVTIESGDDDSDWDTHSETEWLTDDSEFQVSGLFVASFSATNACSWLTYEPDNKVREQELSLMKAKLREVNKIWNDQANCSKTKPKSSAMVSFAPDEELEEICPVEMYERKGEWEVFATERLRFKKRINEMEDILSPCLLPDHRTKIYSTLYECIL